MDTMDTVIWIQMDTTAGINMVSKTEKLALLKQIRQLKAKGLSFREISKKMGRKEAWAGVFWRRNQSLHSLLVDTKDTQVDTPPTPPPSVEPTSPKIVTPKLPRRHPDLEHRLADLEAQLQSQEKRQRLERLVGEMDAEGLALGMLFKTLKEAKAQGTLKFKPRDFRDIQHLLGKPGFKAAWDFCLKTGIVVTEKNLPDNLADQLGVTKTTGGRYVYNYLLLQEEG